MKFSSKSENKNIFRLNFVQFVFCVRAATLLPFLYSFCIPFFFFIPPVFVPPHTEDSDRRTPTVFNLKLKPIEARVFLLNVSNRVKYQNFWQIILFSLWFYWKFQIRLFIHDSKHFFNFFFTNVYFRNCKYCLEKRPHHNKS